MGFFSNCYPSSSFEDSLLISDIHRLPVIKCGLVFNEQLHLIGNILTSLQNLKQIGSSYNNLAGDLPSSFRNLIKCTVLPLQNNVTGTVVFLANLNLTDLNIQDNHFNDPDTVEYITCSIAGLQQKNTQSGGVRPLGLSTLIVEFDPYNSTPSLYQTNPFGIFSAWKAKATGINSNSTREFLEKNYKVKLAICALLEVAKSGVKNIENAAMTRANGFKEVRMIEAKPSIAFVEFGDDVQSPIVMQSLYGSSHQLNLVNTQLPLVDTQETEFKRNQLLFWPGA